MHSFGLLTYWLNVWAGYYISSFTAFLNPASSVNNFGSTSESLLPMLSFEISLVSSSVAAVADDKDANEPALSSVATAGLAWRESVSIFDCGGNSIITRDAALIPYAFETFCLLNYGLPHSSP